MPVGEPPIHDVENVTGELKPPTEFTITFVDVLSPWVTAMVEEDGETEKSGGGAAATVTAATVTGTRTADVPGMLIVSCVVCVIPLPVAVIRSEYVPVDAVLDAVSVSVDVAELPGVTVTGLGRLMLTPAGVAPTHAVDKATCELNPFSEERTSETV